MPIYPSGHVVTASEFNAMFPVGVICPWPMAAAPTGWLLCDGSSLLRAGTYADLFSVIGTTYGTVDGTHFTLPDLRDRMPLGKGITFTVLGAVGGEINHVLSLAEMPSHGHTGTTSASGAHNHTYTAPVQTTGTVGTTGSTYTAIGAASTSSIGDHSHTVGVTNAGSGSTHNNMPPYFVVPFIIRY